MYSANMEVLQYNGEELEVHTGDRGGKHIITSNGKKRYLTENQKSSIEIKKIGKASDKKSEKAKKTDEPLEKKVEKMKINSENSDESTSESDSEINKDNDTFTNLYHNNSDKKSRVQLKDLAKIYKKQIPDNMGDEYTDDIENMVNSVAKYVRGKKEWIEKDEAVEYISNFLDGEFGNIFDDEVSSCFNSVKV